MLFLSPQIFLFFTIYVFYIIFIRCVDNFFIFWSIIEFRTLVFIGLSYSALKNGFSNLLVFFIIQSYSAFILLIFFCLNSPIGFTFSIILKLSIFPFYFWYLSIVPFFRNFIFFFSRTFFKIPSIFLINNFFPFIDHKFLFVSLVLTILFGSLAIIMSRDIRFIIISSSVVNNSWFIISQIASLLIFFIYIFIYFFTLLVIIHLIRSNTSTNILRYTSPKNKIVVFLSFVTIAGLPPFPLFYVKIYTVYNLFSNVRSVVFIILILFVSVLTLVGYLKYVFNILMFNYSNINTLFFNV